MAGDVDPIYVEARAALLDALEALEAHRDSIVLVGAQAIYLHTGDADIAVAAFTSDGDLGLDPRGLGSEPALEAAMKAKGFALTSNVGIWACDRSVDYRIITIDLLVPDSLGGTGSRGAGLAGHDRRAARNVRGLEGCLVDKATRRIEAFDPADQRAFSVAVAGPSALLVSKCFKIAERIDEGGRRVKPKDAHDVLRILRAVSLDRLVSGFSAMRGDSVSRDVAQTGLAHLQTLFGRAGLRGSELAAEAAAGLEDADSIRQSCAVLTNDLIAGIRGGRG